MASADHPLSVHSFKGSPYHQQEPYTHQVLSHHVGPMQEQQFDDFVAVESHSIVQGAVPFLEQV